MKEERMLTVGTRTKTTYHGLQSRCHEYPHISLTGKWLSELGINAGTRSRSSARMGRSPSRRHEKRTIQA